MTKPCPGPGPASRPKFKAPANTCDTHVHVIGPVAQFPLNEDRSYTPPDAPLADFLALQDTLGINRTVVVHPSCYGMKLDVTEDAIVRMGDRARGVAVVPTSISDGELDRLDGIGFRGLRYTTLLRGGATVDDIATMAARIERLGWHIQMFIDGATQLDDMAPFLRGLPVDVVIDHMGHFPQDAGVDHPGFRTLLDLVRGGRCWVKLSGAYRASHVGAPWDDMPPYAEALIDARADRMVWGTDWPHPMLWDRPMPDAADLLDWVTTWGVDDATLHRILVDNPAELYRF